MNTSSWLRLKAMIVKEVWAVLRDPRARITLISASTTRIAGRGAAK
jgi:hypothetical protein